MIERCVPITLVVEKIETAWIGGRDARKRLFIPGAIVLNPLYNRGAFGALPRCNPGNGIIPVCHYLVGQRQKQSR